MSEALNSNRNEEFVKGKTFQLGVHLF